MAEISSVKHEKNNLLNQTELDKQTNVTIQANNTSPQLLENEEKKFPTLQKIPWFKDTFNNAIQKVWRNSNLNISNEHLKTQEEKEEKLPIPNQCTLNDLTYDIKKDLLLLEKQYPQYQPLIFRKWKSKNLRIMQFNMCADGLIGIYKKEKDEKTFLGIDKRCLEWTYRGLKILETILENDCDIICLQECDGIEFFGKYLEKYGYEWIFQPKNESPIQKVLQEIQKDRNDRTIKMNLDGVVVIYKKDKLKVQGDPIFIDMSKNAEKINALAVPLTFKCAFTTHFNIDLLVIVTHPKSTKDEEGEKLRVRQMKSLLTNLIPQQQMENKIVILACDLNSAPKYHNQNKEPLCYSYLTNDYQFQSCYKLFSNDQNEPEFTTLKKREEGITKNCLDYIFVKNNANNVDFLVVACLEIPSCDNNDIDRSLLLPNWYYPSDHFALVSELSFL